MRKNVKRLEQNQARNRPFVIGLVAKALKAQKKVGWTAMLRTAKAVTSLVVEAPARAAKNTQHAGPPREPVKSEVKASLGAKKQKVKTRI